MNQPPFPTLCDENTLDELRRAMHGDDTLALTQLDEACAAHPADPRLTLLRASVHANLRDYAHAKADFTDTLAMAPDLHVARFMLGYLELCHGHADRALMVWAPLLDLESDPELRGYASGLVALVQDRFDDALASFRSSSASEIRYPDIARLIETMEETIRQQTVNDASPFEAAGSHRLLSGYMTRH